jgi:hypothetical protein
MREFQPGIYLPVSLAEGDVIQTTDLPEKFLTRLAERTGVKDNWRDSPFG